MSEKKQGHINKALDALLLKNKRLDDGLSKIDIESAWKEMLPSDVMDYTTKITFKSGKLRVKLNSSSLRQNLSFRKEEIRKNLNEYLKGEVVLEIIFA
jgi:hypothetical protein